MRSLQIAGPVTAEVANPLVVRINDDEIRLAALRGRAQ